MEVLVADAGRLNSFVGSSIRMHRVRGKPLEIYCITSVLRESKQGFTKTKKIPTVDLRIVGAV